jgi:hypothetical protein
VPFQQLGRYGISGADGPNSYYETPGEALDAYHATSFALPGTLADRMTRCEYPGCRCRADPPQPHGPYHQWTRKKNGRTSTRILSNDQLAGYQPWFDNHRRLRELIAELEELSLAIAEADPRWNRCPGRADVADDDDLPGAAAVPARAFAALDLE